MYTDFGLEIYGDRPITLGPETYRDDPMCPGYAMRVDEDVRKSVAFIGRGTDDDFRALGTGFFISHDEFLHFVTAKHVAVAPALRGRPFTIRFNAEGGGAKFSIVNPGQSPWYFHDERSVDVAVRFCLVDETVDYRYFPSCLFHGTDANHEQIGPGDPTYTIGLFSYLAGTKSNQPIVHSGNIAAMPSDELIPVSDWENPDGEMEIEGYLVEQQTLGGLSGSPVFVRPTLALDGFKTERGMMNGMLSHNKFFLLGLWYGAWEAEVLAATGTGSPVAVPLGMGVVIPAKKIMEVLNAPELKAMRRSAREFMKAQNLPTPQSANYHDSGDAVLAKMLNTPKAKN